MASALELRLWIVAAVCAVLVIVLGALLGHRLPNSIDVAAGSLRGHVVPLALFFTGLGRWPVLLGLSIVAAGAAIALRTGFTAVAILYAARGPMRGSTSTRGTCRIRAATR
jgi:hypothetical protein